MDKADPILLNQPNSEGRTPMHFLALRGDLDLVIEFYAYGADPDPSDRKGKTPLYLAVKVCFMEHTEL